MKAGKSLEEMAKLLTEQKNNSRDFIVPTGNLEMSSNGTITFDAGKSEFKPTNWASSQIATYADIPKAYYDRLQNESKTLLADNVNHGFSRMAGRTNTRGGKVESRMLRSHGDNLRALVSSSFKRMDNYDLLNNTLPLMIDNQFQVDSSEITDQRLYLKALSPKLQADVKVNDPVQFGLVLSNSDVGSGSIRVEPLIYRLVCQNGLIMPSAIKKFHVGKNLAAGDDFYELLTDKTKELSDAAFWAQVQDVIKASMTPEFFKSQVDQLRLAANEKIVNFDLPRVVELSMEKVGVKNEKVAQDILAYLANGADGAGLTKWGLVNAFTFAAQSENVDYDESINLERAGNKILELAPSQWKVISSVA